MQCTAGTAGSYFDVRSVIVLQAADAKAGRCECLLYFFQGSVPEPHHVQGLHLRSFDPQKRFRVVSIATAGSRTPPLSVRPHEEGLVCMIHLDITDEIQQLHSPRAQQALTPLSVEVSFDA